MNIVKLDRKNGVGLAEIALDFRGVECIADALEKSGNKAYSLQFRMLQDLMHYGFISTPVAKEYAKEYEKDEECDEVD